MDSIPAMMKVITPLGDEPFSLSRDKDKLTVSIFKGSAELDVISEDNETLVASGILSVPFDCILTVELNNKGGGTVYITDSMFDEVYVDSICEVL